MNAKDLVRQYLPGVNIMQLSTSADDQPWTCNLHYYADHDLNLYWLSNPARRHSKEIEKNPKVSAAILVHENSDPKDFVIGISMQGTARQLSIDEAKEIAPSFKEKLHTDQVFLDEILAGKNPHVFYKLKPTNGVLFDNKNFPDESRQEWSV